MKESVMKTWVAALRSGEYTQGKGVLKSEGTHCCLGVLCEISPFDIEANMSILFPSADVADWAGLSDIAPLMPRSYKTDKGPRRSLSDINDGGGKSFKQIANIIEHNYKVL